MELRLEDVAARLVALDLWDAIGPVNWAIKPLGSAFPYFCTRMKGDGRPVKTRLLLLDGWQTVHDFNRTMVDRSFGCYSSPMEMPHFELVVMADGSFAAVRNDPGYMPRESLSERERAIFAKLLWEVYGVVMRLETDKDLPIAYAADKSVFCRTETAPDRWEDRPLPLQPPRPYVEQISFPNEDLRKARLLTVAADEAIDLDFRLLPNVMTREPRPRCAYVLAAVDSKTGARVIWDKTSVMPDGGLKAMWTSFPPRFLQHLIAHGRVPGTVNILPGRVHRMLHPLLMELSFKLVLHDSLPRLEQAMKV
ncbi:MAG: hypothetical protein IJI73_01090 [Kiritimatiellae bacterium]|nr:hypothetical protein [Kiritimatiellia bacterium]